MNKTKFKYFANPREIFSLIENRDWSVLLDSNQNKFTRQRFDIMTSDPSIKIYGRGEKSVVEDGKSKNHIKSDPISLLHQYMKDSFNQDDSLPFTGGAIGFLSYDQGNLYECIKQKKDDFDIPYIAFGIYDWALIINHDIKETILIYKSNTELVKKIKNQLEYFEEDNRAYHFQINSNYKSNLSYDEYVDKFNKIKSYIVEGDCYQINFSQRFSLNYGGSCWGIYKKLSECYGAPYSAYLNYPFAKIMCFSPERFINQNGKEVETKPIKGTRPVSLDEKENSQMINELKDSDKEKAENLMIVDLLRNDFGKNCDFGSVEVSDLFKIETFANVHHLVSTVKGKLSNEDDIFQLLRDCFPGGSITGAPKIRAMQIINELEMNNRSIYCGAIGYISTNYKSDFNIAIRTVLSVDSNLYFWGGGGITFDSEAESEYAETLAKIKPLLNSLRR